jgi:hypothetical protein
MHNPNLCATCAAEDVDEMLVDTGTCGACNQTGDVRDSELLALYAGFDLSTADIHCFLPRLRSSHTSDHSPVLDWTQIGEKIQQRLNAQMAEMALDDTL